MTIKFDFVSDVSGVTRGTDDIAERFDAVAESLVDLAKGGDAAGDKLEASLDSAGAAAQAMAREGAQAGDKLEASLDQAGQAAKGLGRDGAAAGDKLDAGLDDGSKAADKLERKLEDALDAAQDLGKSRGLDKLEGDLDAAGKSADTFEDKARKAFKSVGDDARKSGDVVGSATKKGTKEASEAAEEFKDEAKSNLSEVASSFSGSMDSAVDLVQGTLGGLAANLGSAGLIGTAVAAVGIGLAKAFAEGEAERINNMGEAVTALATELRGLDGDLSKVNFDKYMEEWGLAIQDTREWWELWQDHAETGLEDISKKAKDAGVDWKEAFRGTKGSMEDSQKALDVVNKKLDEVTKSAEIYVDAMSGMTTMDPDSQRQIDALKELKKGYEDNISVQQRAEEANRLLEAAGVKTTDQIEAEKDAVDKANDALEEHASRLAEAAGAAMSADQAEMDYGEALRTAEADIRANGKSLDINTASGAANKQTLIDLASKANALIQAQIDQGASTADVTARSEAARASFINQAKAAGATAEEAETLANRYGLIPKNVDTMVKAHNVAQTKTEIDGVAAPRTATVNVVKGTENVTSWIDSLRNSTIPVMIRRAPGSDVIP
ncbi:tape measure protein [Arthrobacter phage Idaho]|uniref:Tape measure protein n=1 Tax=Arthrobacter phage Idaho TaxID=2565509 RepID=A0A4D6T972_9CAUD|nr:tape measure protein [Arthrobacter phage Idaho]QCG78275.1 tape measure protein [Arthrobacter phage Idaho]